MPIIWNDNLITLSVVIAAFGSFTALTHAERMRESTGQLARIWMTAGGVTLGIAIWSLHFIGMLAFQLSVPITYDINLTFFSLLPAIAAALLGFHLLRSPVMKLDRIVTGGFLMGLGIAVMHYSGMAALKMQPAITYNPLFLGLSLTIAICAAIGALLIVYAGEKSGLSPLIRHIIGALIMTGAIAGMHYTGMAGANFAPNSICTVGGTNIEPTVLALIVTVIISLLFTGGWIAGLFDRHMAHENAEALNQVRSRSNELAMDREILEQINQGLPLTEVLHELTKRAEALHPDMLCSILLLDKDGKHLRHGAAPSLSAIYNRALDGLAIGEGAGSCGTAAYLGERIIVEDVLEHSYWASYLDLARLANIRSCWSQPIKNSENRVLGTFAAYHRYPSVPSETEIALIERYAHLAQLVIERKEAEDEISHIAFHDLLTQLPNRRLLIDRLQQALSASARVRHYGAVLFIDLDHFKVLNDTKGHNLGDLMLIEVAGRLQNCIREGDTVARLGGDEFVVMLIDLDEAFEKAALQTEIVAEKILQAISLPYKFNGYECHSTASIGINLFCDNTVTVDELLGQADTAMYQSKHQGRNTLHFFDPSMQEVLTARTAMQSDLRNALALEQFSVHYQIQVDRDGRLFGAEALLRWHHPVRGQVDPVDFIPLAEETGLILPIGYYVLETACKLLKAWETNAKTRDLILAVNVSAHQFRESDFVKHMSAILEETEANPAKLKLEMTESLVIQNVPETIEKMQMLRSIGIGFSMDDFGTGYSSLSYLKQLPIQQLKIDKSFINDIVTNPSDALIVKTIISMGNILGVNVIAEGVETESQLGMLKQYGCPAFQGYLFSYPLPIEKFEVFIQKWAPQTSPIN